MVGDGDLSWLMDVKLRSNARSCLRSEVKDRDGSWINVGEMQFQGATH